MIVIPARFPSFNEYVDACRRNAYKGAQMKREATETVAWWARVSREPKPRSFPVEVRVACYEPNRRRDWDGTASTAVKFVLDGLQEAGLIPNDSPKYVWPVVPTVDHDPDYPRIEVTLVERGN